MRVLTLLRFVSLSGHSNWFEGIFFNWISCFKWNIFQSFALNRVETASVTQRAMNFEIEWVCQTHTRRHEASEKIAKILKTTFFVFVYTSFERVLIIESNRMSALTIFFFVSPHWNYEKKKKMATQGVLVVNETKKEDRKEMMSNNRCQAFSVISSFRNNFFTRFCFASFAWNCSKLLSTPT